MNVKAAEIRIKKNEVYIYISVVEARKDRSRDKRARVFVHFFANAPSHGRNVAAFVRLPRGKGYIDTHISIAHGGGSEDRRSIDRSSRKEKESWSNRARDLPILPRPPVITPFFSFLKPLRVYTRVCVCMCVCMRTSYVQSCILPLRIITRLLALNTRLL